MNSPNDVAPIRYRVGIDVGLNSTGFCAVQVDENDSPVRLLNSVVFMHDAGVDPGAKKAADTRKKTSGVARRTRRRVKEEKRRLKKLDELLSQQLGWPLPSLEDFNSDPREVWQVRAQLLGERITDEAKRNESISVAVRHIAHHRGWRNPYTKVDSLLFATEPSNFLRGLNERVSEKLGRTFPEDATQGQLISAYLSDSRYTLSPVRGPQGILAGKLHQSDNAQEIRRICTAQGLSEETYKLLVRAVFSAKSPRGSASALVGHDELPGQGNKRRAEKAHPVFQKFRIVGVLTNLRIREGKEERRLTPNELQGLTDFLLQAGLTAQVTWGELADNLGIERADLRGTAKASFDGAPALRFPPTDATTEKIMACKVKWLKKWWKDASEEQRGYMVDVLSHSGGSDDSDYVDEEVMQLIEAATEEDQAGLDKLSLPQGRAAYSLDSMRKLTDLMLSEGYDLYEARQRIFKVSNDWKPPVEEIGAPVGNPPVDRVLKQVARWITMATQRWGAPVAVNIEHARDGLGSERVARELMRENERRRAANQKLVQQAMEQLHISGKVRPSDRIRLLALQRQNGVCLYCGAPITYVTAEMDHIVPRANGGSTNDRSNLAAVCRPCNHGKGAIPFAVWVKSGKATPGASLEEAVSRVRHWVRDSGANEKQHKQLQKEVIARLKSTKPDEEFDGRSMESVAWMAVELRGRVEGFYENFNKGTDRKTQVRVYRGALTAEARKASGFENRVNLLNLPGEQGKTRLDRRHHAMDALVIALMNQSVSQTLALRSNMRYSQRVTGQEETWKNFYGKPGEASARFETWRESMLRAVELFNVALAENQIPFVENLRLRRGSGAMHDATIHSFSAPKKPDGEVIPKKGYGEQHLLQEALPVELIDRAETPALWTALTRHPDFDPRTGLPQDPTRSITVNGTRLGSDSLLNFFGTSSALLKVRGGYAEIGGSIHHARIYRIEGKKKNTYAMVRVFQIDLVRLNHEDLFTAPLKPSTISMRTADKNIRQALADGTATQIGWLVKGDELEIETDKYQTGFVGEVLEQFPQLTSWRVAGFDDEKRIILRACLLSSEGLEGGGSDSLKTIIDKGWRATLNVLLGAGGVRVIRRNTLGEERHSGAGHLPVTTMLE